MLYATLFGTAALGRVLALTRAFGIFSTGVGPIIFAASHDLLGSYDQAIMICASALLSAALATLLVAWFTLRGRPTPRQRVPATAPSGNRA